MTRRQRKFVEKWELALARMILDGKKELAEQVVPIVEAMQTGDFVYAVCLAEAKGLDEYILNEMRKHLGVRRFI